MSPSRKLRRPAGVLALLCAALLVLAGCTGSDASESTTFQYRSATPFGEVIPKEQRKPAFDVSGGAVLGSARLDVARHKGTVVVVPYWASWCPPCRTEMPLLQNVATRYGDKVAFVGVDFKDDRDSARNFLESYKITFPSVFDQPADNVLKLGNSPSGPPFTMIVDKTGDVAAFYVGRSSEKDITRVVDTLRAET